MEQEYLTIKYYSNVNNCGISEINLICPSCLLCYVCYVNTAFIFLPIVHSVGALIVFGYVINSGIKFTVVLHTNIQSWTQQVLRMSSE